MSVLSVEGGIVLNFFLYEFKGDDCFGDDV